MKTELEILEEAASYCRLALQAREQGTRGTTMYHKYINKFHALAWVLERDPYELWVALITNRVKGLTNPDHSGKISKQ